MVALCVNCCQLNNPSLSHPSDFSKHANNQTEVKHQQLPPASKNFNPPSSFRLSLALFNSDLEQTRRASDKLHFSLELSPETFNIAPANIA